MYYCFLYGGMLDGDVFRHDSPQDGFPQENFLRPGHPEDAACITSPPAYRLMRHFPGPTAASAGWYVYVATGHADPSSTELMRKVLPAMLGLKSD